MKNLFRSFGLKKHKKTARPPWKKKGDADADPLAKPAGHIPISFNCPQCDYPLINVPSDSTPCPNCGFVGHYPTQEESKGGNTVQISKIALKETKTGSETENSEAGLPMRIRLVTDAGKETIVEADENKAVLHRALIDPANSTISRKQHALIEHFHEQMYIKDLSTNGSTFLEAKYRTAIPADCRLVLGKALFRYVEKDGANQDSSDGKTQMLGHFDLSEETQKTELTLVHENSGQARTFPDQSILVGQEQLDAGGTLQLEEINALFEYIDGQWHITNQSQNSDAFVQVLGQQNLRQGQKLLLGNKVFSVYW
jgi:uncharacterized Zn finger protein (UPF0148 family)